MTGHASWVENFPWTRVPDVAVPEAQKAPVELDLIAENRPDRVRKLLGEGSMGGYFQRDDHELLELWAVAVQEVRVVLEGGWSGTG